MTDTPRPQLKRPAFHAWIADGIDPDTATDDQLTYHHVLVHHADQLRAELEGNKLGLDPRRNAMHLSSLWLWAALVRTKRYDKPYAVFKGELIAYDTDRDREAPHDEPGGERDELDARPTGASTS